MVSLPYKVTEPSGNLEIQLINLLGRLRISILVCLILYRELMGRVRSQQLTEDTKTKQRKKAAIQGMMT